jgi:hypothetical protein
MLIITDKQLQRVVQLNRSPHCTSGHEDRVTPHHFYGTRVAQIVAYLVVAFAVRDGFHHSV